MRFRRVLERIGRRSPSFWVVSISVALLTVLFSLCLVYAYWRWRAITALGEGAVVRLDLVDMRNDDIGGKTRVIGFRSASWTTRMPIGVTLKCLFGTVEAIRVGPHSPFRNNDSNLAERIEATDELAALARLSEAKELVINNFVFPCGSFEGLSRFRQLETLDLSWTNISDLSSSVLTNKNTLISLGLRDTRIMDDSMAAIEQCCNLEALDLSYVDLGDSGVERLCHCKALKYVNLRLTNASEQGYASLGALRLLRHLDLEGTAAGDTCLAELSTLVNLDSIQLSRSKVTSTGIVQLLNGAGAITQLFLRETNVDDSMFARSETWMLKGSLQILDLRNTAVTDASLKSIASCRSLRGVILSRGRFSGIPVERLRRSLPMCTVELR
jgi:Leucine-rich repeat (LRR) protein